MDKAPPPETLARYVRWAILLFFAYALWSGMFHIRPDAKSPGLRSSHTIAGISGKNDSDCGNKNNNMLENFSLLASSLLPSAFPIVRTEDIKQGNGQGAVCGQHATLRYQYALESGTMIFSNLGSAEPTHVTIGDGTLLRGVEVGMLGMKPGAERKLLFPSALAFGRSQNLSKLHDIDNFAMKPIDLMKSIIATKVSLVALAPEVPSSSLPLRIIDRRFNSGTRAQCGDTVRIEITIWKLDGTKLFSTTDSETPFIFTIGNSRLPYGIEQSILGMPEGGERTVIIPAAYVQPLVKLDDTASSDSAPDPLKLPEETLLAEVRVQHIGEEAVAATPAPPPSASPAKSSGPAPATKKEEDKDQDDHDESDSGKENTPH